MTNTKNTNLKEKDDRLLRYALSLNIQIVKKVIAIYNMIHGNKTPDFVHIDIIFDDIKLQVKQITDIRQYVYKQNFNKHGRVMTYIKNTETYEGWIAKRMLHVQKVKNKIETSGTTWEYSDVNLNYSVDNWMDQCTIDLAKYLGVEI